MPPVCLAVRCHAEMRAADAASSAVQHAEAIGFWIQDRRDQTPQGPSFSGTHSNVEFRSRSGISPVIHIIGVMAPDRRNSQCTRFAEDSSQRS